jgi:hypothetical protein
MGQEVSHSHFSAKERATFELRLQEETLLLHQQISQGEFSSKAVMGGFEIEACLVNNLCCPAPVNTEFFERFNNPLATPELAKFNIELNNNPLPLKGTCFEMFEAELDEVFKEADTAAARMDIRVLLIGILPTLKSGDCCLKNMSEMKRYKALNHIVLKARGSKPLKFDIKGKDHLLLTQNTVMMEAATTSFQIHLQTPWQQAHHYYNASIIASAPLMAVSGNSPFLLGKQLWHETRIPLFEQAVDTGSGSQRVSFGSGYANTSISECFDENLRDYPVLLPMLFEDEANKFSHLRLHNGVIWRWNRPLVGFDPDGTPHIRVEHRILPAGPTIVDMMANAVFFYGLSQSLMHEVQANKKIPFKQAKDNFYEAAKNGLNASIVWNNKHYQGATLQKLIIDELLPQAEQGLRELKIPDDSIKHYLGIIAERTSTGQTGAIWQMNHLTKVDGNMKKLTQDYLKQQHQNQPVHSWAL